jgi:hypothetical protein
MKTLLYISLILFCSITYSQVNVRSGGNLKIGPVLISNLKQKLTLDIQTSSYVEIHLDSDNGATVLNGSGCARGKESFPVKIGSYTLIVLENGIKYRRRFRII